jgi:tRNA pseudouridine32 synthase / 23S rRNA pseudouridine746 synthase
MITLHSIGDFIDSNNTATRHSWKIAHSEGKIIFFPTTPSYWYEGYCPQTGEIQRLPRTPLVEEIAYGLMRYLATDEIYSKEGKMYGVLLVELPSGEQKILKAFSGLLNGSSVVEGWVPPIPGREEVAFDEARTLAELETIKQELISLQQLSERQEYEIQQQYFDSLKQKICDRNSESKQKRQEKRETLHKALQKTITGKALAAALEQLDEESRREGIELRQLKRDRDEALQPLKNLIDAADNKMRELKLKRKELSRQLQAQMHATYSLMNFWGTSLSLRELMPAGLPTGTGDCCAPKLLHYAATHGLKALAMAEFWWGPSSANQDKIQGEFYAACAERCQPLMGFMLSGLKTKLLEKSSELEIIYEDKWLIAVNKPPGLLSVPGRYSHNQDSVLSRLRNQFPEGMLLNAVHRLDQETSGILLIARDLQTYRQLSQQFANRQVKKVYEAVLSGIINVDEGVIELPLWGNPSKRPYQEVNWQYGKPSVTQFRVIGKEGNYSRVEFMPLTGRTHQLRVHSADKKGLGVPILGDKLYGCTVEVHRLYLHARELGFVHPVLGESLCLRVIIDEPPRVQGSQGSWERFFT